MLHLMLRGNHYSKLSFDRNGRVNEIRILHPDNVIPYIYEDKLYYRVTIDEQGRSYVLLPNEIIHLKLFGEDGIIGKSPLSYARETVGMALAANDYAAAMYENGGGVRGVIERAPMNMTGPQMDQLRNEFVKIMRDYRTSGSIGVLRGETKFTQIALSPKDAQFIESANLSTKDIARFFGVPLHLIGDLERSTNNNIEHQSIEFVMHTVRPLVKNWESELNRKVLRKSDRSSMFFRFNIDSLMRGDTAARAQYYQTMTNIGAMSLDEVRNMENLNPIADGYGQQHYMQLNMTTLQGINEKSNLTNANTGQ
jgi:HK97 family phage portal protein